MLVWPSKAATEVLDYSLLWDDRLAGDTISTSVWAITGGDAPAVGTLAVNSNNFAASATTVVLAAGNSGITYTLSNTITTAGGRTLVESVQIPVSAFGPSTSIASLSAAMQWLGVASDDDGYVARVLAAVSAEIQSYLGYSVVQANYTRTFDGNGQRRFFVPDIPLQAVSSVTIDGVAIPQGVPGTNRPGFYFNAQSINLIGYGFTRGFQNLSTSYVAGYQTVPADIVQACLDWTKNIFISGKMLSTPSNIVRVSAGDTSFDFGNSGSTTDPRKIPIPPGIYAVLLNYQRVTQISGW